MSEELHSARLDRVETEVGTIRQDVSELKSGFSSVKADVRGLSGILQRIEQGVSDAQQQWQDDKQASRINPIALATVLITIISILVGGAWLVSGNMAQQNERSVHLQRAVDKAEQRNDDRVAVMQRQIDKAEQRQWELRGGPRGVAPAADE